jgi:hypothetical protein
MHMARNHGSSRAARLSGASFTRSPIALVLVLTVSLVAASASEDGVGSTLVPAKLAAGASVTPPPAEPSPVVWTDAGPRERSGLVDGHTADHGTAVEVTTDAALRMDAAGADDPPTTVEPVVASATPVAQTTSNPVAGRRRFGVATPSNGWSRGEVDAASAAAAHEVSIVLHYLGFGDELQREQLQNVAGAGAISLLTWEPYDYRAGTVNQSRFALRRIIDGDFDDHILRTARTIRDFDRPVLLRFAHEMNGDWYPWSERVNGNRAGEYVAAYRHVHDLVTSAGAHNVTWVWSPNVEYPGSLPLDGLYPGHAYVDVVAVDGYNFGTSQSWSSWQRPDQLFGPTLSRVRSLSPGTPIIIGETGSSEVGGDKAGWITELFSWLDTQRDVRAVVWFHLDKETDWRIDSSAASAEAFARGLSGWLSAS